MNNPFRFKHHALAALSTFTLLGLSACAQDETTAVTAAGTVNPAATVAAAIAPDVIRGRVTGPNGPEAGVWVIAETRGLPTRFARIVVTNDNGEYLLPELPDASYDLWVRGYGLVDSAKVQARPGTTLDLDAVVAPDAAAAAEYYPAGYWYSMLNVPGADQFPGTGPAGNGLNPGMRNKDHYNNQLNNGGCIV
jgi:hypothetical protein